MFALCKLWRTRCFCPFFVSHSVVHLKLGKILCVQLFLIKRNVPDKLASCMLTSEV